MERAHCQLQSLTPSHTTPYRTEFLHLHRSKLPLRRHQRELSEICQIGYLPASSNAGLPGWPKSCEAGGLIGRPSGPTRRKTDSSRIWTAAQDAVWIGAEDGLRSRPC